MNKIRKKIVAIIMVFTISCMSVVSVGATEQSNISEGVVYDLESGGTQTFEILDEDNNIVKVTIKELVGRNKIANGSYQIEYTSTGCWEAGFIVDISNNQFTRAHSGYAFPFIGSIRNNALVRESATKVTYRFNYFVGVLGFVAGCQATISGSTLKVVGL